MIDTDTCHVCGDTLDGADIATCNNCERRFHMRLRQDSEGVDCGEVWISEQYLALEFACFACLGRLPEAEPEPPIGSGH